MEKLSAESHGTETSLKAARFLVLRLGSRPESTPLVPAIAAHRDATEAAAETHSNAQDARIAATAEIGYRDHRVDRAVHRISRKALDHTDNNRNAPFFKRLFPEPASELVSLTGGDVQRRFVTGLVNTLETDETYADLQSIGDALKTEQALLLEAETRRDALRIAEDKARVELSIALDALQRAYNLTYPRLQLLFPDDSALVESFFRNLRS